METLLLPLVGLGGLYYVATASASASASERALSASAPPRREGFDGSSMIPNVDVPDPNFGGAGAAKAKGDTADPDSDSTQQLARDNAYYGEAFTDKYFNQDIIGGGGSGGGQTRERFSSLTGETVDIDYFRHNNMQPFFGSSVRGGVGSGGGGNEAVLDAYAGQGSQTITKRATAPLFDTEHLGLPYGAPGNADFFQSRVNPSMRMANVKPFEEIRVGPGLGTGFDAAGHDGFNAGMMHRERWMDKTVDDLRVANKPKASGVMLFGHEVPDSSVKATSSAAALGEVNKNRVDTYFEMGHDRLMTTTGLEKGVTMHGIPIDRRVSRPETAQSYIGGASVMHPSSAGAGEYMPSKHQDLEAFPFGPVAAANKGGPLAQDYQRAASQAYPNNRSFSSSSSSTYFGSFGGAGTSIGSVVAPLLDMLRPTRKEDLMSENLLRPFATNANAQPRARGTYAHNPNEALPPTIRETTQKNERHHAILQTTAYGLGAYHTAELQPTPQQRDVTSVRAENYLGIAGAGDGARGVRVVDADYRQRNNHLKPATGLPMVPGNLSLFNRDGGGAQADVRAATRLKEHQLGALPRAAASFRGLAPSTQTLGRNVRGDHDDAREAFGARADADRLDPDLLLAQLKGNPYTLDIRAALG